MEAVRILHVIHSMDCGGAENLIMNLYRAMDKSKIQFDFLVHTNNESYFEKEIITMGGKIYKVPYYKIINQLEYTKKLKEFFNEHREIKIVHGHLGSCAHIYLKLAKENGCITIAHSHSTKPTNISLKNIVYRMFTFRTRRIAQYFFGCSRQSGEYRFGKKICNGENFFIVNNAIDTNKYIYNELTRRRLREEFEITDNTIVFGHVGRMTYAKNHIFLIQAFNAFQRFVNNNSKLLLVGDGELKNEIVQEIKRLDLTDSVIMTGVRNDVPDILQAIDVFVFPSRFEGLPVSVVEAQASDLWCLISESITEEVVLTEKVIKLPINVGTEPWVETMKSCLNKDGRSNRTSDIVAAGYDVSSTASWLKEFYISKYEKR